MPDVLFALTGDVRQNSRALRQLRALADLGASVEVLGLTDENERITLGSHIEGRLFDAPEGSGPLFFWRTHKLFRQAAGSITAAVYHASDLYVLPAMSAARAHGASLVFDSRELYPHVASTTGRPWVRWFWQAVESAYIPRTDAVFTVNESIAAELEHSYSIPQPTVLYNAPDFQEVASSNYIRRKTGLPDDRVIILHQGSMRRDRGCEQLVEAMAAVDDAALVFLGNGPLQPKLETMVRDWNLQDRIHFVPRVPPDELLPVTASADVGVTLLQDTCRNHRLALPNKLFEYLMAGVPVVGSDLPEIGTVIEEYRVGLTVKPDDPDALARNLQMLTENPDLRSKMSARTAAVFNKYSWERGKEQFEAIYSNFLARA